MSAAEDLALPRPPRTERWLAPGVLVIDNLMLDAARAQMWDYLYNSGWKFGWKSNGRRDYYSFWHLHFAGHRKAMKQTEYECSGELKKFPIVSNMWQWLATAAFYKNHDLVRCYANGQSFGSEGTLHTDSKNERAYTAIYYPHAEWKPDWGGETVLFNDDKSDIVASIYPRPNRLLIFRGNMWHVARAVARTCPHLRMTLMFKTRVRDDQGKLSCLPAGAGSEASKA